MQPTGLAEAGKQITVELSVIDSSRGQASDT